MAYWAFWTLALFAERVIVDALHYSLVENGANSRLILVTVSIGLVLSPSWEDICDGLFL